MASVDQSQVRSGFDIEVLLSERYLRHALLTLIDTGTLPLQFQIRGGQFEITIHPPEDFERLYEVSDDGTLTTPLPAAIIIELLFAHPSGANLLLSLNPVVLHDGQTGEEVVGARADLFFRFSLETELDDESHPLDPRVELALLDIESPLVDAAAGPPFNVSKEEILEDLRARLDRSIDLGIVGEGEAVQTVALRAHPGDDDHSAALGVYLNLKLRDGPAPGSFLADRGNLAEGRNFLARGNDLAFATRRDLLRAVGRDLRFRQAEKVEGHPFRRYHYPIRNNPRDPDSKQIGRIRNISVFPLPERNTLRVDLHGEYFASDVFQPDFHVKLDLTPILDDEGLLDWEVELDVDVSLLFQALPLFGLWTLFVVGGGGGLILAGILAAYLRVAEEIVALQAQALLSERVDEAFDASFFQAFPDRVTVERRRWDPLYATLHQVVTRPGGLVMNRRGIAFWGTCAVGKQPQPVPHAVIRDERRDDEGLVTHLRYRVRDVRSVEADFLPVFPGTDRRPFNRSEDDQEPNLVEVSVTQAVERIADHRLQGSIPYSARRVHIVGNQVDQVLSISRREINEQRARLLREFRDEARIDIEEQQGEEIRAAVTAELEEELGEPPTEEQIEERFEERVEEILGERERAFRDEELPGLLDAAVTPLERFDLSPHELAVLQRRKLLLLRTFRDSTDVQLIEIRRGLASGTLYYRDRPDGDVSNNLMSLPRYRPSNA